MRGESSIVSMVDDNDIIVWLSLSVLLAVRVDDRVSMVVFLVFGLSLSVSKNSLHRCK